MYPFRALLHDIADSKFYNDNEIIGPKKARFFLEHQKVNESIIIHIENIIKNIFYKGGNFKQLFTSPKLAVVQDVDRLDGAIRIARCLIMEGLKTDRELETISKTFTQRVRKKTS